jgi:hypothetical protein
VARRRTLIRRVLDLTDPAVCVAWGLTAADLASNDHTRCQEVAAAAREDGYEAIRYASAAIALEQQAAREAEASDAAAADNLVIFADRLHPGSDVRVVRSELLPLEEA